VGDRSGGQSSGRGLPRRRVRGAVARRLTGLLRPTEKRKVGSSTLPLTTHMVFTFDLRLSSRLGLAFCVVGRCGWVWCRLRAGCCLSGLFGRACRALRAVSAWCRLCWR